MVVSRKDTHEDCWKNLEGYESRLSGPYSCSSYMVNWCWHRLYGRSIWKDWNLNNKSFNKFKDV